MRLLCFFICSLFLLTACSYSAKSVITITGGIAGDRGEDVVAALRKHRDGCFSKRNATMLVVKNGTRVEYYISNRGSALDLLLTVDKRQRTFSLELNERSERAFSAYALRCHQQLTKRLIRQFGKESISTIDSCEEPPCR